MAGGRRIWTWPLAAAVLILSAGAAQSLPAQEAVSAAAGSIAGKLTDLNSKPVEDAVVVLRNEATGAEMRSTTQKNGIYSFTGLDSGMYSVEAESAQLGRGALEHIFVAASHETRVQTAMEFELLPQEPVQTAAREIAPAVPAGKTAPIAILAPRLEDRPRSAWNAPAYSTQKGSPTETSITNTPMQARPLAQSASLKSTQAQIVVKPNQIDPAPISALPKQSQIGLAGSINRSLAIHGAVGAVMQVAAQTSPTHPMLMQAAVEKADPVTPVATTKVSGAELQALPASGRRWQDFVLDTPAASTEPGGRSQASLRGAGEMPADTTIDGASIRLAFGGQGGYGPATSRQGSNGQGGAEQNGMGQAWSGGRGAQVAEAAIREVEIEAGNVEAEGSRTGGGRVNMETLGGANGLHGQGFFFDRQNTWGAQNPFTQWVQFTGFSTTAANDSSRPYTPPDHETVWGIGIGGQIRRNKLFWFAALDSSHRNDPGLSMVKQPYLAGVAPPECTSGDASNPCYSPAGFFAQPTNDQMQVLSARLGLSANNPIAEGLAAESGMMNTLNGLLGPAARTAAQWVGFVRIDWQAAERHHFTLEGIGADWNSPGGGLTRVSETYGTNSFGNSQAGEQWMLGRWEAFITPNLLAVTQGSLGRTMMSAHAETPSAYEQTLLAGNAWGQLPQINVDNRYGFTIGNPSRFGRGDYPDERLYQGQETVDWIKGKLMVKSGFELSHNFDATSLLRNQTGTYDYSSVENFASDALAFAAFGTSGELNPFNQHNCDQTGKVWRDSGGGLRGVGALPCYSSYSQMIGPADWQLSTNDWAGFVSTQWQPNKFFVLSAGLRWEREQLPPPIAKTWPPPVAPTSPSGTQPAQRLPDLGNDWGPRLSLAVGDSGSHWPVLRLGYGMYYGRTENATVETALSQTGSANGDQYFFIRPTDGYNSATGTSGAQPFPDVLTGPANSLVAPGAVEFSPRFRNPEVHQGVVAVEEELPGHVEVTASAMVSLGRRLPISIDTNYATAVNPQTITYAVVDSTGLGPIKSSQITVPFYASWPSGDCNSAPLNIAGQCGRANPGYQQITQITSRANSTYEGAMLKVTRYGRRGLSLHAHYTYSHSMDWNPNESTLVSGSDVLDPANFGLEYGTSNLDVRHSAAAMVIYETPWKLHHLAGQIANGWMLSGIGQFHSGMPYTMRTSGSLAKEFDSAGTAIVGLAPGMNGSGGDNRVYGLGSNGVSYNIGRNTYRYPLTWKADVRLGKKFDLGGMRQLEFLAESFNLFNHQNVTELETTGYYLEAGSTNSLPTLNFLTGVKPGATAFGQPLAVNATNFYRERQIQLGARFRF